ncbi:putative neurochondrin [Apostichopus japonicus]|uniref:Putative neurochondrin n=1 Tax=Stichopus japonicus TaxID=307972 RepID=A0A2G8LC11_STIJA|nr:putative neurochondrin [Apostichopus japonicus]
MATATGEGNILAADAEVAALERCLKVLKTAKSDTEIFAALLLITKLARAETMTSEDRGKIFKAVGFQFINRLLNTESVPEDCDQHMFQSLALTLLACFSTDPNLAHHPELLAKIPFLSETILIPRLSTSDVSVHEKAMISDAYDILQAVATSEGGRKRLCEEVSESLVIVIKEQILGHDRSLSILSSLLYHNSDDIWMFHSDLLNGLFQKLAVDFHQFQDAEKFKTFELLTSLLSVTSTVPAAVPDWAVRIRDTISGVLRNKLGEDHRDVCLQLAATMLHHYGATWVLQGHQQDEKFFPLLVNLASIEVRMILETMNQEKQLSKAAVLCCCFAILERCIQLMVCNTEEINLGGDVIYQLHTVLTAAFGAATYHLKSVTKEQFIDPVVVSCLRALFMWLAEETAQLKSDVIELLPLLIDFWSRDSLHGDLEAMDVSSLTSHSLEDNSKEIDLPSNVFYHQLREDLIQLFLPGLCHLTAEKESRDVVLHNQGFSMLVSYTNHLLEKKTLDAGSPAVETSIITLSNIFLNVILQDPSFVRESDESGNLLLILSSELKSSVNRSQTSLLHIGLVFVSLLRIKPVVKEFEGTVQDAVVRIGSLLADVLRSKPGQLEPTLMRKH